MEKTNYGFWKSVDLEFEEAIERTNEALKEEGFGILTELDFKAILKKKPDVDFKQYQVLAACNPPNAYKALQAEEQLRLLFSCNVNVYGNDNNETIAAAIDPVADMTAVNNNTVREAAETIQSKLKNVISSLQV